MDTQKVIKNERHRYRFPTQRIGKICNIFEELEFYDLTEIVEKIKSDPVVYETLLKKSIDVHLKKEQRTLVSDLQVEQYEGTAIHSPSFVCDVSYGENSFEFISAATIIVCLKPNRSKVWCRSSLTKVNGQPAIHITKNDYSDYFEKINSINEKYTENLCNYFRDTLKEAYPKITCDWNHTIDIRAVSSLDEAIHIVSKPIEKEMPFSIIELLENEESKSVIKDQVYFAFNKEIDSVDDYNNVFNDFKKTWIEHVSDIRDKPDYFIDEEMILQKGYQWFGYSFQGHHAIFLRKEDLDNNKSFYFGITTDSDHEIDTDTIEEDPKTVTRSITGVVVRNLTRHI